MRLIGCLLLLVAASRCAAGRPADGPRAPGKLLGEAEAVARAEHFVRVNGYVRTEDADPKQVVVERHLTYGSTPAELLPQRRGTLLPRACGVLPEAVMGFEGKGWSVVFCFNPAHRFWHEDTPVELRNGVRERSRVVVMDPYGTEIFMLHMDLVLKGHGIKPLPGLDDLERQLTAGAPAAP